MERIQRLYISKESTSSLDMIGEPLDANDPANADTIEKVLDDMEARMRQSIKSRKEFFATFKGRFEALSENIQINAESLQDYRELLSDIRHEIANLSKIIDSRSNDIFSQEYQNMLEMLKSYEIRIVDEISLCKDYPQQTTSVPKEFPPQQATANRGRPKQSLKDNLLCSEDKKDVVIKLLHSLIDGRKGKSVALVIVAAQQAGIALKITFAQAQTEFGEIGNQSGFNRYVRDWKTLFKDDEINPIIDKIKGAADM